jgi:hypothetical protein
MQYKLTKVFSKIENEDATLIFICVILLAMDVENV